MHYVRIGRAAVEHWAPTDGGLTLRASVVLPVHSVQQPEQVGVALQELCEVRPTGPVTLLFESAWLPVMLVDLGSRLWSVGQLEALLRHRLDLLYGADAESSSTWALRLLHHAGDCHAVGYGLQPSVLQAVRSAAEALNVVWAGLLPASAWGWQRVQPVLPRKEGGGWWVWPEQDRNLLVRVRNNRWAGLHAGAAPDSDEQSIKQAIAAECVRLGVSNSREPITAAHWHEGPSAVSADECFKWRSICRPIPDRSRAAQTSAVLVS